MQTLQKNTGSHLLLLRPVQLQPSPNAGLSLGVFLTSVCPFHLGPPSTVDHIHASRKMQILVNRVIHSSKGEQILRKNFSAICAPYHEVAGDWKTNDERLLLARASPSKPVFTTVAAILLRCQGRPLVLGFRCRVRLHLRHGT